MTQTQLGAAIGWSKASVSAAERSGKSNRPRAFALRDLDMIAAALGVTPVEMVKAPPPCSCCGSSPAPGMICRECGAEGAEFTGKTARAGRMSV
jgi:hypothetical protein